MNRPRRAYYQQASQDARKFISLASPAPRPKNRRIPMLTESLPSPFGWLFAARFARCSKRTLFCVTSPPAKPVVSVPNKISHGKPWLILLGVRMAFSQQKSGCRTRRQPLFLKSLIPRLQPAPQQQELPPPGRPHSHPHPRRGTAQCLPQSARG